MKVSAFSKVEMSPLEFGQGVFYESGDIAMSDQEQSRAEVICLYIEGHIKQKVAAKRAVNRVRLS